MRKNIKDFNYFDDIFILVFSTSNVYGLWRVCKTENLVGEECSTNDEGAEKWNACRAFSIMAVLGSVFSALMAIFHFRLGEERLPLKYVAVVLVAVGTFGLFSVAIFTFIVEEDEKIKWSRLAKQRGMDITVRYGWAFVVGWVGTIGAFATSGLTFFIKLNNI